MKPRSNLPKAVLTGLCFASVISASAANYHPTHPFDGKAGTSDSQAIWRLDGEISGWAAGVTSITYGESVSERWQTPSQALGQAEGRVDRIVCLGRGGQITLELPEPVSDAAGWEIAVFENSFDGEFLELGWVEVSHDGSTFVRFPNYSYTFVPEEDEDVGIGGSGNLDPRDLQGLASKYIVGFGTPFDLDDLRCAYEDAQAYATGVGDPDAIARGGAFSAAYRTHLLTSYPLLQGNPVRYVRILDIVGDGSARDSEGFVIWDAWPTSVSAGFDLDGVAYRLGEFAPASEAIDWPAIANQPFARGSIPLEASVPSGASISYELLSGSATINGEALQWFATGEILVRAVASAQAGEAAPSAIQSFTVAPQVQYLHALPIPNQLTTTDSLPFSVASTAGLPVTVEVFDGPAFYDADNEMLTLDGTPGTVTIVASQAGEHPYAPAEPIEFTFDVVPPGDAAAPETWSAYATRLGIPTGCDIKRDSDGEGTPDVEEFLAGTSAADPTDFPRTTWDFGAGATGEMSVRISLPRSDRAVGARSWQTAPEPGGPWTVVAPRALAPIGPDRLILEIPFTGDHQFARGLPSVAD